MQIIDREKLKNLKLPKEVEEVYLYLKAYAEAKERKEWLGNYDKAWNIIENDIWEPAEKSEMNQQKQVPISINDAVKGVQTSCSVQTAQRPEVKFYPIGSADLYIAELLKRGHDVVWEKNENSQNAYDFVEEREIGGLAFFRARVDKNKGPYGKIVNEILPPKHVYFDKDSNKRDFSDTNLIYAVPRSKTYIMDRYGDVLKDDDLLYRKDMIGDAETKGYSEGLLTGDQYKLGEKKDTPQGIEEPEDIWEIEASMVKMRDENWIIYSDVKGEIFSRQVQLQKGEKLDEVAENHVPVGGTLINTWPRNREIRELRIIVGKKLIESTEDPHGEDSDGDSICHIIGLKAQKTRNAYPISPTTYARDPLRLKNKALMQFVHAQAHNNNAPLAEAKSAVTWTGEPGTPGSRAVVDVTKTGGTIGGGLQRIPSGSQQTGHFLEIAREAKLFVDEAYDAPAVVKGDIPKGTDPSGRAMLALMDSASTVAKPKISSFEAALVRLAKVNVAMMLSTWPRVMWERLIEPDEMNEWLPDREKAEIQNKLSIKQQKEMAEQGGMMPMQQGMVNTNPGTIPIPDEIKQQIAGRWQRALDLIRPVDHSLPSGISMIDLDVKITAGSSLPTNRMAKREVAREDFKIGLVDRKAALKYADDPDAEEISMRMDQADQATMQAQIAAQTGGITKK